MRIISLDTETTGINLKKDRIVEIGCIEIINNKITGKIFHKYLNPNMNISLEAFKIHGISNKFLKKKKNFSEIYKDLKKFINNNLVIIHNASFDINIIKRECKIINKNIDIKYLDTLEYFRKIYPNKKNTLDAICKRMNIDRKKKHSAIKDAEDLAKCFLIHSKRQLKMPVKIS
ncbi:exonuclease domain-containing protein [Candidatus Vidania fulgoroideorum]